jgi:hypothetical protein
MICECLALYGTSLAELIAILRDEKFEMYPLFTFLRNIKTGQNYLFGPAGHHMPLCSKAMILRQ